MKPKACRSGSDLTHPWHVWVWGFRTCSPSVGWFGSECPAPEFLDSKPLESISLRMCIKPHERFSHPDSSRFDLFTVKLLQIPAQQATRTLTFCTPPVAVGWQQKCCLNLERAGLMVDVKIIQDLFEPPPVTTTH